MVLKRLRNVTVALIAVSMAPTAAHAAQLLLYTVQKTDCTILAKSNPNQKWSKASLNLKIGQHIVGRSAANDTNVVIFKLNPRQKTIYAAKLDCTFGSSYELYSGGDTVIEDTSPSKSSSSKSSRTKSKTSPSQPVATYQEPAPSSEVVADYRRWDGTVHHRFHVSLGLISWQEPLTLAKSDGTNYDLKETTLGTCIGGGWEVKIWRIETGLNACGIIGASEAGSSVSETIPITYRVKNARAMGVMFGPTVLWRPFSGNVALGFSVPIIFRNGNWPSPTGYTVSPTTNLFPAPMIEARLERGHFFISQKIGFYRSMSSIVWLLQGSYSFDTLEE